MTPRSRHGRALAALAGAVLLVASACADGDGSDGGDVAAGGVVATSTSGGPTTTEGGTATTLAHAEARPSTACGSSDAEPVVEDERTLVVDGTDRRYLLTVPSAHDGTTPLPVVFDWHGLMEGAEVHAQMSQYSALAEEEGFVAVFPHGTGEPVHWNAALTDGPNADLDYFDAVLDELGASLCLDEARIYATGLSNGAMFTSLLLCRRADVLAAAAPVAGLLDTSGCEPSRPVPVLAFHGTADPILLFNGGVDATRLPGGADSTGPTTTRPPADLDGLGYPASVAAWAAHNGCDPTPSDEDVAEDVVLRTYDCPPGADVEFYVVLGGGHSWPSSEFSHSIGDIVGPTSDSIDATRDAWAFLSRFTNP